MTGTEIRFEVEVTASPVDGTVGLSDVLYLYTAAATARRTDGETPEIAAYQRRSGWTPGAAAESAIVAAEQELARIAVQAEWLAEEERQARLRRADRGESGGGTMKGSRMYRYTIILDRYAEEDFGPEATADHGDEGAAHHDGSDLAARVQVAREIQEAMDETGLPVGFFEVISREAVAP